MSRPSRDLPHPKTLAQCPKQTMEQRCIHGPRAIPKMHVAMLERCTAHDTILTPLHPADALYLSFERKESSWRSPQARPREPRDAEPRRREAAAIHDLQAAHSVRRRGCERGTRHREQACRCVLRRPEAQSGTGFERSGLPGRINVGAVALPVGSAAQGGVADRSRPHGMHACRTRRHLRGRPRKCGCWSLSRQIPGVFPEHPQWVTPKGAGRRDSNGWNSEIEDQCKSKGPAVIERIRYAPEARRR